MTLQPAEKWFRSNGWKPFEFQREVWRAYLDGESGLVHAATGTGKTLAAWWGPLLEYIAENRKRRPRMGSGLSVAAGRPSRASAPALRVLWITPLRALAADTAESLMAPVRALGLPWTVETRTGDTPAPLRSRQSRRLPTALVTTPESLSLLLSRENASDQFTDLRAVVVDEWHELMGTKRVYKPSWRLPASAESVHESDSGGCPPRSAISPGARYFAWDVDESRAVADNPRC